MTNEIALRTHYYQQFDADFARDVPAEGYGGWKTADLPLALDHTAVVVMHAWDCGTREQFPGLHRAVEYIPRAYGICRTVFPKLLEAVRKSPLPLFHVVGYGDYYKDAPGYLRARELAGPEPPTPGTVATDPVLDRLRRFRGAHVFFGEHNQADSRKVHGSYVRFPEQARPVDGEGVAENGHQLLALCRERGVNHLIYAGFAINWCLLLSPGGMAEMSRHGILCSAIRQAVTAVENKETARGEWGKENALWRVAVAFGFVYDLDDLLRALPNADGRAPAQSARFREGEQA